MCHVANYPTMYGRPVCKDPKPKEHKKIHLTAPQKWGSQFSNTNNKSLDHKCPALSVQVVYGGDIRYTDIATYRLNRPRADLVKIHSYT